MPSKNGTESAISVFDSDPAGLAVLQALAKLIADQTGDGCIVFEQGSDKAEIVKITTRTGDCQERSLELAKPLRAGRFLDALLSSYKAVSSKGDAQIEIGGWLLDVAYNTLSDDGGQVIKLTEKETAILQYLKAQGSEVGKEELLKAVWEYAEDVETHTLETHIYRLRQKIEDDPAEPKIVMTTEKGYALKV